MARVQEGKWASECSTEHFGSDSMFTPQPSLWSRDVSGGFSLGWAENILKELFDLVDVGLDLAVKGDEWGVRARCEVLEVCGLPEREVELLQISGEDGSDRYHFKL